MNKKLYFGLLMSVIMVGCSEGKTGAKTDVVEKETLSTCSVRLGNMQFTQAKNGAEENVTVINDTLKFVAGPQTDYFRSPDGNVINNSPVIFTKIDNTKPFTFTARVEPKFTETGTYSAGVLYIYEDETHNQKLCFEQDENGAHRVVTVRTVSTSDDNNHQAIEGSSVYMRISSDTKQIGSYYSEDGKIWRMARLYGNDFPKEVLLGLSSQSPKDDEHTSYFSEVSFVETAVLDFRSGKLKNE